MEVSVPNLLETALPKVIIADDQNGLTSPKPRTSSISDMTSPTLDGSLQLVPSSSSSTTAVSRNENKSNKNGECFHGFDNETRKNLGLKELRLTSQQTQEIMKQKQIEENLFNLTHMVGTVILNQSNGMMVKPKGFSSANEVASRVNSLFGLNDNNHVTGRGLSQAVKRGDIGIAPPKQGRPSIISDEDTAIFASAIFTMKSIAQANGDKIQSKQDIASMLHKIINEDSVKASRGGEEVGASKFMYKLKKINSECTKLQNPSSREAIRFAWLTFNNLNNHFVAWEKFVVEIGMARQSTREEFEESGEYVKFYPGQADRIINADEMGFGLSNEDNSKGGRPAMEQYNPNLPNSGNASHKSSSKTTFLLGVTMNDEVIPPLLVLMSSAQRPNVSGELLSCLKQIKGKFGHNTEKWFDPVVSFSEKSSITAEIFVEWIIKVVQLLYPNVEDKPGKRVVLKLDCGPGRYNEKFLLLSRACGIYFFPGLPNGTELTQEMDQLYHAVKSIMEHNRTLLYDKRYEVKGASAKLTLNDMPKFLHGGYHEATCNNYVQLRDALGDGLDPILSKGAREKIGYVPATRAALKSSKLRYEFESDGFYDGLDSSDDEDDEDNGVLSLGESRRKLVAALEKQNHEDVRILKEKGYKFADVLKKNVKKLTTSQVEARTKVQTRPLSDDRIESLTKWKTVGEFTRLTNGGDAMNGTDALIAREMVRREDELKFLTKKKKDWIKIRDKLEVIVDLDDEEDEHWSQAELYASITLRDPKKKGLSKLTKPELWDLWKNTYSKQPVPDHKDQKWTASDARRQKKLMNRLLPDLEKTSVYKDMMEFRSDFYSTRLLQMTDELISHVCAKVLNKKDEEEQKHILELIEDRIANNDDSLPINDESSDSDDSIDSNDSAICYEDEHGSDEETISSHESNDEDDESRVSANDFQEEDNEEDNEEDYKNLPYRALQALCKARGITAVGKAPVLIKRLEEHDG